VNALERNRRIWTMRTFYIAVKLCHRYDLSPSYIVTELTCHRFDMSLIWPVLFCLLQQLVVAITGSNGVKAGYYEMKVCFVYYLRRLCICCEN